MAEQSIVNGQVRVTDLQGIAIQLVNKTGAPSVKGTLVSTSTSTDNAFMVETAQNDVIGVVYDSGIADGQLCGVVILGVAQVLLEDSTASTKGYWVYASTTDGRANATLASPPGGGIPEHDEHFKEIGHCVESAGAGTSILAKVVLHFN